MITLQAANGTTVVNNTRPRHKFHDIAVKGNNTGTLVIKGRKIGSSVFEDIPDGTITLSAPVSIQVEGVIEAYEFTISGISGSDTVQVTDTSRN